jgi:hypothetical protein
MGVVWEEDFCDRVVGGVTTEVIANVGCIIGNHIIIEFKRNTINIVIVMYLIIIIDLIEKEMQSNPAMFWQILEISRHC